MGSGGGGGSGGGSGSRNSIIDEWGGDDDGRVAPSSLEEEVNNATRQEAALYSGTAYSGGPISSRTRRRLRSGGVEDDYSRVGGGGWEGEGDSVISDMPGLVVAEGAPFEPHSLQLTAPLSAPHAFNGPQQHHPIYPVAPLSVAPVDPKSIAGVMEFTCCSVAAAEAALRYCRGDVADAVARVLEMADV